MYNAHAWLPQVLLFVMYILKGECCASCAVSCHNEGLFVIRIIVFSSGILRRDDWNTLRLHTLTCACVLHLTVTTIFSFLSWFEYICLRWLVLQICLSACVFVLF